MARPVRARAAGGGARRPVTAAAIGGSTSGSSYSTVRSIGHYLVGKKLGEGTFGVVRQGRHILSGEHVAIKVLDKSRIVEVADVTRVSREIAILKRIRHGHKYVVQLYEVIDTPRQIFLVMEHADGGELFDYIVKKGRLHEAEACALFHQIVDGVDGLHAAGVCHRDLKPENILLTESASGGGRRVKIIDFGLSNTMDGGRLLRTACGSPCYASPEMVAGHRYVGAASDLWSLGVVLFAMVCGYLPFEHENTAKLYQKILSGEYHAPRFVSQQVRDLMAHILDTDPRRRFSADDIRRHPWYRQVAIVNSPAKLAPVSARDLSGVVLRAVEDLGLDPEFVAESVMRGAHNHAAATYFLVAQRLTREGKVASEVLWPGGADGDVPANVVTHSGSDMRSTATSGDDKAGAAPAAQPAAASGAAPPTPGAYRPYNRPYTHRAVPPGHNGPPANALLIPSRPPPALEVPAATPTGESQPGGTEAAVPVSVLVPQRPPSRSNRAASANTARPSLRVRVKRPPNTARGGPRHVPDSSAFAAELVRRSHIRPPVGGPAFLPDAWSVVEPVEAPGSSSVEGRAGDTGGTDAVTVGVPVPVPVPIPVPLGPPPIPVKRPGRIVRVAHSEDSPDEAAAFKNPRPPSDHLAPYRPGGSGIGTSDGRGAACEPSVGAAPDSGRSNILRPYTRPHTARTGRALPARAHVHQAPASAREPRSQDETGGGYGLSTSSALPPGVIMKEVTRVLAEAKVTARCSGPYAYECEWLSTRFVLELRKIERGGKTLYVVRSRPSSGVTWVYKDIAGKILSQLAL